MPRDVIGRRAFAQVWIAVWLVFLLNPLHAALTSDAARGVKAAAVAAIALFAVLYLALFANRRRPLVGEERSLSPRSVGLLAGMLALTPAVAPAAGARALDMVPYLAVAAMFTFDAHVAWALALAAAAAAEALAFTVPGWGEGRGASLPVLLAAAAVFGIRIASRRNSDLMRARVALAERAVDDERARMTRDMHDILGHSLTVIAVKSELAGHLVEADPARCAAEIADVERLARGALADVRATIAGSTSVTLAGELVSAGSALDAGGIDAELPTAVDDVPVEARELYGWVVREGVTNVLRHSGAHRCRVRVGPDGIAVEDDGAAGAEPPPEGQGLRGLRARARAAGAAMTVSRSSDLGGLRLAVGPPEAS